MTIRRFTAETMALALTAVKAALGDEAVILETSQAGNQVVVTAAVDDNVEHAGDGELVREVRALLGVVRGLVDEQRWGDGTIGTLRPEIACLHHRLVGQGVDGVIAAALVRATAERLDGGAAVEAALAGTLADAARIPPGPRVRLFVGPPGDGKTTTVVKLAAAARRAGRRVALVSTDTYRVGAEAALAAYGRVLGTPVATAGDPAALSATLARLADSELVLVDTAGVSPGQRDELDELEGLTRAAGADAGRTLVASATHGRMAAHETWQAFAGLAPDACVLTKVDVAPGAPLLGLLWRAGVPVSHLGTGRRIPEDLEAATPDRLARCLLVA